MRLFNSLILFYCLFISLNAKDIVFTKKEQKYIEVSNIKVAMVPNIYPFNMYENGKLEGFSYDVLQLISKKSGLNFSFEIDNWSLNLRKTKYERLNSSDPATFVNIETTNTDFLQISHEIPLVIFSSKYLDKYNDIEELTRGVNQNLFFKNDINSTDLFEEMEHYGLKERYKALPFSSVDLVVGPLLGIQSSIIKNGYADEKVLRELKIPFINKDYFRFGVNKDNQPLYSIIQKTFDEISEKEWNDLNRKWTDVYLSKNVLALNDTIYLSTEEKRYLKNKKSIQICTHHDLAPLDFIDKDGQLKGLSIDILNLVKKQMNIVFKYKKSDSLAQSLSYLRTGECDIVSSVDEEEVKSKDISFTKSYLNYKLAIITKKENPLIPNLDAIMDKTISIKKDSVIYKKIRADFPYAKFIETDSDYKAIDALNNKKSYFTLSILPVASYYISKYVMNDLYISLYTDISYDIKMALRSEDKLLLGLLNRSLEKITPKQKKEIENKWSVVSVKEAFDYSLIWKIIGAVSIILLIFWYRQSILNKYNKVLKKANEQIQKKTLALEQLTNTLEQRVKQEVEQNEQKTRHLIQQSRLAQMGELISMIAHQWRQPLTSVSTTANYILAQSFLEKPLNKKELEEELSLIIEYTQHLSSTIDDFRNFYKIDKEKTSFTLEEVTDKSISIIKPSLEANNIKLNKNYNGFKKIYSYATEINQAILSLVKNAEDVLVENKIEFPQITLNTYIKDDKVYLEVADNGGGIKEEYFDKLFDPYFSTKTSKDGSGLGLYMCKIIVEDHCNGVLKVDNINSGVKFTISI